jgi:FKBP-type peptidyl-prolyl cis-trans isomerase
MSCGGDEKVNPNKGLTEDSLIVAHLDSLGVTYQKDDDGIYSYPITLNPTGKSQDDGKILSIYYTLDVLGGQTLNTYDETDGDPIRMKQGANAIYPLGVDKSLAYLKEDEEWVFIIPSALAYVDYSSSLIPEKAILQLQVTLKKIQNENDIQFEDNQKIFDYSDSVKLADTVTYPLNQPVILNNGMIYKRLIAGADPRPLAGDELSITYRASLPYKEDAPIDVNHASTANPFIFIHNDNQVITALDAGVARMQKGETALLVMPSLLAYRESARVLPDYLTQEMVDRKLIPSYAAKVGPYEVLIFEVKLLDIN